MVRQLISKVSRGHMKKLDPIKNVVIERQAFVNNKLNTNHQALSACLGP
jgi:hypothetical protein